MRCPCRGDKERPSAAIAIRRLNMPSAYLRSVISRAGPVGGRAPSVRAREHPRPLPPGRVPRHPPSVSLSPARIGNIRYAMHSFRDTCLLHSRRRPGPFAPNRRCQRRPAPACGGLLPAIRRIPPAAAYVTPCPARAPFRPSNPSRQALCSLSALQRTSWPKSEVKRP